MKKQTRQQGALSLIDTCWGDECRGHVTKTETREVSVNLHTGTTVSRCHRFSPLSPGQQNFSPGLVVRKTVCPVSRRSTSTSVLHRRSNLLLTTY